MGAIGSADLLTYLASAASAFFGAAAAFAFNMFKEKSQQQSQQLTTINVAIYGFVMTLESLLSLKRQALLEHSGELAEAAKILSSVNSEMNENEFRQVADRFSQIYAEISKKDSSLNGVFMKWEECDYPMLPKPESLAFTVTDIPEVVRLALLARNETNQVRTRIIERNALWHRGESVVRAELLSGKFSFEGLIFRYEMLTFREAIRAHADIALIAIHEALKQLQNYRMLHYRKRGKFWQKVLGKKLWVTYKLADDYAALVPDRKAYARVFWSINDEIKEGPAAL